MPREPGSRLSRGVWADMALPKPSQATVPGQAVVGEMAGGGEAGTGAWSLAMAWAVLELLQWKSTESSRLSLDHRWGQQEFPEGSDSACERPRSGMMVHVGLGLR